MRHETESMPREALEHLAADAESQRTHLRQIGTWPSLDELALEFDDVAAASESWATPTLRERVPLLDRRLAEMSGESNATLWQVKLSTNTRGPKCGDSPPMR